MFTQVDRTLERSQGGLGIGLTLVKRLVELHDGTVEAFSEGPGRGSEFVVRLPVLAGPPQVTRPAEPANKAQTGAPRRVLVVDDNPDSADIAGDAPGDRRQRDAHGARRPRGCEDGGSVPSRGHAPRHRPAEA